MNNKKVIAMYQNGKIYCLRSHQTDDVYIGSTVQPLYKRFFAHKRDFKSWQNEKFDYLTSFKIVKYEDAFIELIENYPCNNVEELRKREGEIIRGTNCVNKRIEGRTQEEKQEYNEEYQNKYREENKEQIQEQRKQHYQDNKEQIQEYKKQYYQDNKENISEKRKKKFVCECGSECRIADKNKHLRTNKHIKFLEQNK